jgi:hypothetical protein
MISSILQICLMHILVYYLSFLIKILVLIPSDHAGKYISKMSIHVINEALYYLTSSPYNLNTFETYKST